MSKRLVRLSFCIAALTWIAVRADVAGIRLLRLGATEDLNAMDEQLHRGMKWSHGRYFVMDCVAGQPPVFYRLARQRDLDRHRAFPEFRTDPVRSV